jgi:hypothetical protein
MDAAELKSNRAWARTQNLGFDIEEIFVPGSVWRPWIKADGTQTSTPLPTDAFHIAKFRARGWTLGPLKEPVVLQQLLPGDHRHTFDGRARGSACTDARCNTVRQQKFHKRNKGA